jgi:transposase
MLSLSDKSFVDKDAIIEKQRQYIKLLEEKIQRLEAKIQQLEERIAQPEKNSSNSSRPPSSDIVKPVRILRWFGEKRERGGQNGHARFSRQPFSPDEVDEVIKYELKGKRAVGLKPLDEWFVIQQVVLPDKMYRVVEHHARKYIEPATGKICIAPIPAQIRKGGLFGVDINAAVTFMKGGCHMSYTTIQQFLREIMKLDVSRGLLVKATQKVSLSLRPVYDELVERLPTENQLGVDETGHHDEGILHWTWCFDTPAYSVFRIDKSRGCEVLQSVLGSNFAGIICADYWGAYRKYARLFDVRMQYCMAHLIREIRFLAEHNVKKLSRWGNCLLEWLKKLFRTLHCRDRMTAEGFMRRCKRIKEGFLERVRRPPEHKLAKKLARRFKGMAAENYFRFITNQGVEPTNNNTERQIRPLVIDRRITQGTRSEAGMQFCERIWTILATCKKQNRNVFDFIHRCLLAHWANTCYPELL